MSPSKVLTPIVVTISLVVALGMMAHAGPPSGADKAAAEKVAEHWLSLLDEGKFAQCWEEAAPYFREKMKQKAFVDIMKGVAVAVGKNTSRKLAQAVETKDPPDAPPGTYIELLYDSSFTEKKALKERVSLVRTSDGTWAVDGYHFVR